MIDKNGNEIFPIYQLIDLIFDLDYLSSSEKLLLIAFMRFYNRKTKRCFPGLTTLSCCTGLARKTIIENIKKLSKKKVIKVKSGNRIKPNEYSLLFIGWLDTTPQTTPQTTPKPSKVKGKGIKKNKAKKVFIPPKKEDVILYFHENSYKTEIAVKAFNYYDVADWHDSTGKQVSNWKQKMQSVWFKSKNKVRNKIDGADHFKDNVYIGTPIEDIPWMNEDKAGSKDD